MEAKLIYTPLDTSKSTTRVVYIRPREHGEQLFCILAEIDLADKPAYLALSYVVSPSKPSLLHFVNVVFASGAMRVKPQKFNSTGKSFMLHSILTKRCVNYESWAKAFSQSG
jgi:hypothetical protein